MQLRMRQSANILQGANAVSWCPVQRVIGDVGEEPYQKRLASCGNDKLVKIWVLVHIVFSSTYIVYSVVRSISTNWATLLGEIYQPYNKI